MAPPSDTPEPGTAARPEPLLRPVQSVVGRREDHRLLTGRARYVSNLKLPRLRHVAFVRSPYGHATITGIEVDQDIANRSDVRVFTGDSPGFDVGLRAQSALPGYVETTQPALASGKVRFAGEPVAAIVAADRYLAEDAAEGVVVDYEPLPVTVSVDDDVTHPVHDEAPDNRLLARTFTAGDTEAALEAAAVVVRRRLETNRHGGNPLEGRAGVALWEPDGGGGHLTLWLGTQIPHLVRNLVAELLGLAESRIRVVAPDVGGGFGTKAVLYPEDITLCLLARAMPGIPVKWVEDRLEHLSAATAARDHRYDVTAAFDADGHLLAVEGDVRCNVGAYSVYPWTAGIEPLMAGGLFTGPYKVANYTFSVAGIATNTAPAGPYRGVARPATVYAMECLLDSGARALGLDPIEIRRRNLITTDDVPYRLPTRLVDDTGHYGECLDRAVEAVPLADLRAEQARRRRDGGNPIGVGLACYNELTGLGRAASAGPRMPFRTGHEACTVRVNPDGRVLVISGVTSQGQGLETTLAQVVAAEIGVDVAQVDVSYGDTDRSLWGFGAFSSRQGVIAGGAARRAGEAVRQSILALAAELYEANDADLRLSDGLIFAADLAEPIGSLAEIARVAYLESNRLPAGFEPGLDATRFYDPEFGAFAAGAQVVVIEIEPRTGHLDILHWVCVEDAGRIINEQIVNGQIAGSIAQGIGGAQYEHLIYDTDGNLRTSTLLDYLMPTASEIPELDVGHISRPADNPLGVRGVGEGGTLGPAAALASAIDDALGVGPDELPLTPERIWNLLERSEAGP